MHDDAKNPPFFGWEGARRRKRDIHPPTRLHVQGVSGGVLRRGGHLVGADDGLLPCGGVTRCHDDENFIMAAGAKWLGRSIFVGKTNLGGRFWQRSGTHDPCQRATTSLKLGESDVNVV